MVAVKTYTTALAKGHGIIPETLILLNTWEPGITPVELANRAVHEGLLGKATANRVHDVVKKVFAPRYLVDSGNPAKNLKELLNSGLTPVNLQQLFLLYTARANAVLHDFIVQVYWPKYASGQQVLSTSDALAFLESAYAQGKLPKKWNENMTARIANGLCGCLADFGLLEKKKKSTRIITPIQIASLTSLYLAYELHFSGYSDDSILVQPDWQLFGLQPGLEVVRELQRVAKDYFIVQFSGELMRISWKYQTMEEALHVLARAEF